MIITLMTDFGTSDAYVAAMKGVILSLAPKAELVDACHDIAPQDVQAAAWTLGQYWSFYPKNTLHLAVVDPGVGTARDILLVLADEHLFLAPDNGLLAFVFKQAGKVRLRKLKADVHQRGEVSATFHGRDVFAYVAGLLAAGRADVDELSEETSTVVIPSWAVVREDRGCLLGEVVHVDHFGNLITNIARRQVAESCGASPGISAGTFDHIPLKRTYGEASAGELVALFGSSDTLEIAVVGGSAAGKTGLVRGATVVVKGNRQT